jgi:glycosyltransferase involved in cell wall biosynthesis
MITRDKTHYPTISVVVPVKNGDPFISRTISSISDSRVKGFNLEVIVVDNHSIDGTRESLKQFIDLNIKVIRPTEPLQIYENWTLAINSASGEFIKLVCADDLIDKDCLISQFQILTNPINADISAVFGTRSLVDEYDNCVWGARSIGLPTGPIGGIKALKAIANAGTNILGEPLTALFRSEAIKKAMPWPSSNPYMLDLGGYLPLLLASDIYISNQKCGSYRVHKATLSNSLRSNQAKQFVDFVGTLPLDFRWSENILMYIRAYLQQYRRGIFYRLLSHQNGRLVLKKVTGALNGNA